MGVNQTITSYKDFNYFNYKIIFSEEKKYFSISKVVACESMFFIENDLISCIGVICSEIAQSSF